MNVTVFGETIALTPAPGVFMPSPHGLFYAHAATVRAGERAIDIGPGSGVLAVTAHVLPHRHSCQSLAARGTVSLGQDERGTWFSYGYVYELRLLRAGVATQSDS
jgi:hypothetical protein